MIHYDGNSNSRNQHTLKALDGSTLILEKVQNECDLGITLNSKLSFKEHIVNKVNPDIWMIK